MISESTRQAVLDRDNWQCQQCGAQLERGIGRHHLHHLSYVDDEPDHLTSMCPSCHKKTDHTEMGASEHYGDKTVVTVSRSTLNKVIELQIDLEYEKRQRLSLEAVILCALDALDDKRK
jgi:5-methylcytosine-specific restriction endonuclease McrA